MNHGLQIARAVACLGVVVSHAVTMSELLTDNRDTVPGWIMSHPAGFGVTLFFVISGYVMGSILDRPRRPSPLSFVFHRLLRIYPAYWAAIAVYFAVFLYFGQIPLPLDPAALLLSPVTFHAPHVTPATFNIPAWTLMYEMGFYVLVFAWIAIGANRRQITVGAGLWTAAIAASYFIFGQPYLHPLPGFAIVFSPINLSFIVGLLVGLYIAYLPRVPTSGLVVTGFALWSISFLFEPSALRLYPTIFQALSCATFMLVFLRWEITRWQFVVSIGNASYGIYLIHLIAMDVLHKGFGVAFLSLSVGAGFAVLFSVSVVAGYAFGLAEYSFYRRVTSRSVLDWTAARRQMQERFRQPAQP